jgi:small-conductance mechanosensitive channel
MKFRGFGLKKISLISFIFVLFVLGNTIILAQNKNELLTDSSSETVTSNTGVIRNFKDQIQYIDLCKSIEKNIQEEKKSLFTLKKTYSQEITDQDKNETSFNDYKIKLSSYTNLLAMENIQIKELERTYISANTSIYQITELEENLKTQLKSVNQLYAQTSERYDTNKKQLAEISIEKKGDKLTVPEILVENLETLTLILEDKLNLLNKIRSLYKDQAQNYTEIKLAYNNFKNKCQSYINEKRTKALFKRRSFDSDSVLQQIRTESIIIVSKWESFFSSHFWKSYHNELWQTYGIFMYTSLIVFFFIFAILFQLKQLFKRLIIKLESLNNYFWCTFAFHLFSKSIIIIGVTLLCIVMCAVLYYPIIAVLFAKNVLIMWLFTKWILDAAKFWGQQDEQMLSISNVTYNKIFISVFALRLTFIFYAIVYFSLDGSGFLLDIVRMVFETVLLVSVVIAWKIFFKSNEKEFKNNRHRLIRFRIIAISVNFIVCASLLMELSGFSELSIYWQLSWTRFGIVLLWSVLIFMLVKELNANIIPSEKTDDAQQNTRQTLKWTFIRTSFLIWGVISLISFLLAWGVTIKTIINLFKILNHPIPVGGMQISLPGFVYSFIILLLTHMIVKIWRTTILKKMLANSGMAKGIQDTISTITSYSFWVFGTILALNAVGISTTSLTVAFGALGIGLGFGLQNIFNNFISGLILLFERPIQVGDWVEINGIWGCIEKINVRSTVVKSVDNAALIIPNSEFISSRLTNWSFKDPKIRRTITIGVAYGSNIHKVRDILLDIATKHPRVYRMPAPDVVFTDFGDSALIFELRIWVHVDYSISTRTDIRFEIDRRFKEEEIVIPFPQRDVHIYQTDKEITEKSQV